MATRNVDVVEWTSEGNGMSADPTSKISPDQDMDPALHGPASTWGICVTTALENCVID
ncbi:hypothetical protein [Streptomyces ardesiacus]|uniref:hypothetical protein n=1 Tax=Streptomyces ardesiacus TaxID=285564 RepID=UPI00201F6344|nr:hypothetical protein [Streptomyces ardesiacus]